VSFNDTVVASPRCPQERNITRTWTAVDSCGNVAIGVQTIHLHDLVPPNLTVPPNLNISCEQAPTFELCGVATAVGTSLSLTLRLLKRSRR
jgi:hypothetical protein